LSMSSVETRPAAPKTSKSAPVDFQRDPRWQLIERILATPPFQHSTNLHGLLSCLAKHSILARDSGEGKTDALTERQIGTAVFGKAPGYSPAEDSSVRVHMRQLRLRLHEYFAQQGVQEDQRVDIPKGSYLLEFEAARPQGESASPVSPRDTVAPPSKRIRSAWREAAFGLAVAAAVVCGIGWFHSSHKTDRSAVPWPLDEVIQPGRQTTVVVSDANLSALRFMSPHEISLDEYLQPGFREGLVPLHQNENVDRMLSYVAHSELTSFADAAVLTAIANTGGTGKNIVLTSARDLDQRDLESGNYVFVGSAISNPWVSLFADKLNFQIVEEGIGGSMSFRNRNPLPGEQAEYEGLARTGSGGEDFATISLLPGSMEQGNVLILQGLRQEGTEALAALLGDAKDRAVLERAVHKVAGNSPYFEALVRARAVAGAPVSIDIVTTRRIQP